MDSNESRNTDGKKKVEEYEHALSEYKGEYYILKLFITGLTPRSREAIENVRKLCDEHLKGRYQLQIIDIYQEPLSARENQIVATPTLIRKLPLPIRKYVGKMSRIEKLLAGLDIQIIEK